MPRFTAPIEDISYALWEVAGLDGLAALPVHGEVTPDLVDAVLAEAGRLAEEVVFPLNQSGDREGCRLENGVVRTPAGFPEAYRRFIEGGWTGISADPDYGGQGLPGVLGFVMEEIFSSANMAFTMYSGLSKAAYNLLAVHGSQRQKAIFLPRLVDGTWSGTMCLTEPQCGTDLGLVRTRAVPDGEDAATGEARYRLDGAKIFISAGEHDLTENIVHLVLARLPDAPPGTRGLSLFAVPKFLPRPEGEGWVPGPRNGVRATAIEHKMGIRASATCQLAFEGAEGYLVGEAGKGMRAMFVMMNTARLAVGIQGISIAETAYQNALAYALERRQGRALTGARSPEAAADLLIVHPDVRRELLIQKAFIEGARALAYWVATEIDHAHRNPDPARARAADDLAQLMTPVLKAYCTDMGFEATNRALQVFGGHGYIAEMGVEQYVRDARISAIYEGANGIQALDLVGRKLPAHTGRYLRRFFRPLTGFIEANRRDPAVAEFIGPLEKVTARLQQATGLIAQKGMADPTEGAAAASDYLRALALVAMAWMWARMAKTSAAALAEGRGRRAFNEGKIKTARFFYARMLPEAGSRLAMLSGGAASLMAHEAEEF